ncbi:MAG: DUF4924 family protein [Prolixibacteraceae bacterium]|jgi:hypothetical protein|nr:DUF4924 family protein [Prolixibacteraceae bacterium]
MIVAREKRKNNIAEYIIYMWQVEDLIRALKFDTDAIDKSLVAQYQVDDATRAEVSSWYANLVLMMEKEQKQNGGHVQFLVNLVNDLNRFHLALLTTNTDEQYSRLFNEIKPDLELVKQKSGIVHNDIETALNTLYLLIMLKMKEKNVSEGTQQAVWKFGNFLGYLSKLYKMWEAGDLELEY